MAGLTAKQEQFCRAVGVENLDNTAAYVKTYDTSKWSPERIESAAAALAGREEITARIAVLRDRVALEATRAGEYDLDAAIAEADLLVKDSQALGQAGAAVAALRLKVQLAGHLVERKEVLTGSLDDTDTATLRKMREALKGAASTPAQAPSSVEVPSKRRVIR